jgi:DNA-binding CsgD family transcriptional regulator
LVILRDLGFSGLQEVVYQTLLADPSRDVRAISVLAGTDEAAVQAVLEDLTELGVLRASPGAPARFSARDPGVAIGELIERLEDEALRRQRRVAAVRAQLPGLVAQQRRGAPSDGAGPEAAGDVETISVLPHVRERLDELSFHTRSSVWSIQPAGPYSAQSRAAAVPLDQRGLRRGLDTRIIYDIAVLATERGRAGLRHRALAGAQIRLRQGPLQRLIIMDERVAVLRADPRRSDGGAVIVRQPGLLSGLRELFWQSWETAQELPSVGAGEPDLSEDDQAILGLLADGLTDEIAARKAGVSVRHFRRRVARLMDRLRAGSRFQAGAAAARRGWV